MSLGIVGVCPSLSTSGSMASKREKSKDTVESETGYAIEQVFMSLPI